MPRMLPCAVEMTGTVCCADEEEAREPPHLFRRSHHNKPAVAFPSQRFMACFNRNPAVSPAESIILTPSTPSRLGTELKEEEEEEGEKRVKSSSGWQHAKYQLCASDLSKNNHKLSSLMDAKCPCRRTANDFVSICPPTERERERDLHF